MLMNAILAMEDVHKIVTIILGHFIVHVMLATIWIVMDFYVMVSESHI